MNFSPAEIFFFSDEIQKAAGMPAPQAQSQPEKKKNIISRHIGKGTLALGALGAAAALKNPAAASKYLGQLKDTVMRPGVALKRGFRSGSSNVMKGPGASEAASKRVRLYKDVMESAQQGQLQSVKSLDDIAPHRLDEIAEFFRTYKNLEKKVTEILDWQGVDRVNPLIDQCIEAFKNSKA